jgi:tetratricopeptide (TPR) repeat protein
MFNHFHYSIFREAIMLKKLLLATIIISLYALSACEKNKTDADKETIKAVIMAETKAYAEKNYDQWASYWAHNEDVLRLALGYGYKTELQGWSQIDSVWKNYFKNYPEPIKDKFVKENYVIHIDAHLAWAAFDEFWIGEDGEKTAAKNIVTLKKIDGTWKFVSMTVINFESYKEDYQATEDKLYNLGDELVSIDKPKSAIKVFELCLELFPESIWAINGIGEAYEKEGLLEKAVENYKIAAKKAEEKKFSNDNLKYIKDKLESAQKKIDVKK